jgi:hypothetical protein
MGKLEPFGESGFKLLEKTSILLLQFPNPNPFVLDCSTSKNSGHG